MWVSRRELESSRLLRVCCLPHPCGSLAQESPAPAHVPSLVLVCVSGEHPHGPRVSSPAGSRALVQGSPSSILEHDLVLAVSPSAREFSPVVVVVIW